MKRGFTLIELLGVIIILALLMIFAFPNMINFIKSSNDDIDDINLKLIYNASEMFVKDNAKDFYKKNGNSYCITLQELVDEEYLKMTMILSSEGVDLTSTKSVQINYNNGFTYELKDKNNCVSNTSFIRGVTAENKTLAGKIPEGNFDLGDEYIVNVDGEHEYHFYILSVEEDKVNLIMSDNVSSTGQIATSTTDTTQWMSHVDYAGNEAYYIANGDNKGPVTSMNYLYNATKDWKNLENVNDKYTDPRGKYMIVTNNEYLHYITILDMYSDLYNLNLIILVFLAFLLLNYYRLLLLYHKFHSLYQLLLSVHY